MTDTAAAAGTVTETAVAEPAAKTTKAKAKAKVEKTGNLIADIAAEVENLSKPKALTEARRLSDDIETNYFRLGGVLKIIQTNGWWGAGEGDKAPDPSIKNFDDFVTEKFGFEGRKARYLISIYDNLVTKSIPWEKVQHLGWSKLKDLAPILTPENLDEWVAKAETLTVRELMALIKTPTEGGKEKNAPTSDDIVNVKFKLKTDQNEVVQQALAKAKGELHTEYDTVALENICAGYLGGNSPVAKPYDLDAVIKATGFETLLVRVADLFPEWDIAVQPIEDKEKADAAAAEAAGAAEAGETAGT